MKLEECRTADPTSDSARVRVGRLVGQVLLCLLFALVGTISVTVGLASVGRDARLLVRLLGHGPPAGDPSGRVWGRAQAETLGDNPFVASNHVVCDVQSQYYVSGKNGGWREESRQSFQAGFPTVTLEDGRVLELGGDTIRFEPYVGTVPSSTLEARYRKTGAGFRGPRLYEECLRTGEVFVDGCVNADSTRIVPCSDHDTLWLTAGKRRLRLAEHVKGPGIALFVFALGWVILVALLAKSMRGRSSEAGIGLAVGLAPRGLGGVRVTDGKTKRKFWLRYSPALALPALYILLCNVTACPAALFWASLALVPLALGALEPIGRQRTLQTLLRAVIDRPTTALAAAEGDAVELAVRVAPNAPTMIAPLSEKPAAHVSIQVWQRVVRSSGRSSTVTFDFVSSTIFFGGTLLIEDATGGGTLELGEAILDFTAGETIATSSEYPRELRERSQMTGGDFLVRESILQPGDPLFVIGPVRRTLDPASEGSYAYRAAPTKARVSQAEEPGDDTERHPLFVHAGTERTLLDAIENGITRETTFSLLLGVSALLVAAGLVALTLVCLL